MNYNEQMRALLDAHFYSILYYNAVIWLKQNLLSISANALRSCLTNHVFDISFDALHKTHKKCTPSRIMYYQMSLNLYKIINSTDHELSFEVITVLNQIICSSRQLKFKILRNHNYKIGLNTTANKMYHMNDLVRFDLLYLKFVHHKKIAKLQFLKYGKT